MCPESAFHLDMCRQPFSKTALTFDQQIERLSERGMQFIDRERAVRALACLNYYRLTAYWFPFYADDTHTYFEPGTCFETVLAHHEFDRALRGLVFSAIEQFEVALRTQFAYHVAHEQGPFGHEKSACFVRTYKHAKLLKRLHSEIDRSSEPFIQHYRQTYDTPVQLPVWMACEVMSFGALSSLFSSLKQRSLRQQIASLFGVDEKILVSFTHHITLVRNICAHHARLWNKTFPIKPVLPKTAADARLVESLHIQAPAKLFNTLVMLDYFLCRIGADTERIWITKIRRLINEHTMIDATVMGFPTDWRRRLAS